MNRPRIADTPLLAPAKPKAEVIYAGSGPEAVSAALVAKCDPGALPAQGIEFLRVLHDIHFRYPSLYVARAGRPGIGASWWMYCCGNASESRRSQLTEESELSESSVPSF